MEVTPAEVAEELMKSDDADIALTGLAAFLQQKKQMMKCTEESKLEGEVKEEGKPNPKIEDSERTKKKKSRKARRGKKHAMKG